MIHAKGQFKSITAFRDKQAQESRAIFLFLISLILFTLGLAIIKKLGQKFHITQIIALRQSFMFLFLLPAILKKSKKGKSIKRLDLLFLRSFINLVAMITGFSAVIFLPLATITTISFTRTIFSTIFAIIILKETIGIQRIGALLAGFAGVLIIARPANLFETGLASFDTSLILSLTSSACIGINQIIIRVQTRYDHPSVLVGWQAGIICLATIPLALWKWLPINYEEIAIIALIALTTSLAQYCSAHAFKMAQITLLAPFDYFRLVFSISFGLLFFAEWPDIFTWLGAAIIVGSTLVILRQKTPEKQDFA